MNVESDTAGEMWLEFKVAMSGDLKQGGATGGLGTVQRYRRAFRWNRAARLGSNRSADETEEPEEEEASMLLFPLRALSAYSSDGL